MSESKNVAADQPERVKEMLTFAVVFGERALKPTTKKLANTSQLNGWKPPLKFPTSATSG